MRQFQIWAEGYVANGDSGPATMLGTASGETFADACTNFYNNQSPSNKRYYSFTRGVPVYYWGCKLHDNETDARKNYG